MEACPLGRPSCASCPCCRIHAVAGSGDGKVPAVGDQGGQVPKLEVIGGPAGGPTCTAIRVGSQASGGVFIPQLSIVWWREASASNGAEMACASKQLA